MFYLLLKVHIRSVESVTESIVSERTGSQYLIGPTTTNNNIVARKGSVIPFTSEF
jgi:hypothetical protein